MPINCKNLEDLRKITNSGLWNSLLDSFINVTTLSDEIKEDFGVHWVECGHRIREQINNDSELVTLLRHMLPKYEGGSIILYRGENQERLKNGLIGLAWTPDINTARMFASGLNSIKSGGVLLAGHFEPEAVISGPNHHSTWLGENQFTIDPFSTFQIDSVELFPSII